MNARRNAVQQEWRSGWTLILASALGISVAGVHLYALGVFIEPLQNAYGWSRAQIAGVLIVPSTLALFLSPLLGVFVDRYGSRRIGLPGVILYCSSIASLSFTGSTIWTWWALWLGPAVALLFVKPTVWSAAISSRFQTGRGFALAVALCGTGLCSSLTPVMSNYLITHFGWRAAFPGLGLVWAVLVLPVTFFFFFDARDQNRKSGEPEVRAVRSEFGYSFAEGLRSRHFFRLAVVALVATTMIVGFVVHLVPLLGSGGLSRGTSAGIAGLLGVTSVIGRLSAGYCFDRFSRARVAMISLALPAICSILLLTFPGSLPMSIIAAVILGLAIGGELDAVIYLSTRYFGLRNYGALFGCISALISTGAGLGPLAAGYLFDISGSYVSFLILTIPASLLCSLMLGSLGPYPDHGEGERKDGTARH